MDTLQCAIVLAKLELFDWEVQQRFAIGACYNQLMDDAGIPRVQQRPNRTSVFAQYTVLIENREIVQKELNEAGIPTAVHYPIPLSRQPAFAYLDKSADSRPVADEIAQHVMSLPMGPTLMINEQRRVVEALSKAVIGWETTA